MIIINKKNSTNIKGTAPDNSLTTDIDNAVQTIVSTKWTREIEKKYLEVETAKVKGNVRISLETKNISDDTELIVSLLDAKDNSELMTTTVKLKKDKGDTEDIEIKSDWYNKELIVSVTKDNNSNLGETYVGKKKLKISCCEHAIVRGDEGDLIKEINVRLAGFGEFGCPLPQNKFDERTEKAVKQFQRDYIRTTPTGIVCKYFLEKLDKFCEDYYIKIDTDTNFKVKCPCVKVTTQSDYRCTTGFGEGRSGILSHSHKYNDGLKSDQTYTASYGGIEKPGIHRSLLWAISAMKFYLENVEISENLQLGKFDSSYRCKGNNIDKFETVSFDPKEYHPAPNEKKEKLKPKPRTSNNHMGNAIDIHIFQNNSLPDSRETRIETCDKIRKLFVKYSGALIRWPKINTFCLEPSKKVGGEAVATTWVHIDCRQFSNQDDELYCQNETDLKSSTFQNLYSSNETDSGKWMKISECAYSPTTQTTIPSRVDKIWIGILNLPINDAKKAIKQDTKDNKQIWEIAAAGDSSKRNQCVVEILDENDTEYKVKPQGQDKEAWINKTWIIEVVKFKE